MRLGNARDDLAVLHPRRVVANPAALYALLIALAVQVATVSWAPLRTFLRLESLAWTDWLLVVLVSAVPAVVGQALKLTRAKFSASKARNIPHSACK